MRGSAQENPRQVSFPGSGVVSPQLVKFVADFESKILRPVREKRAANDEILAIQSVASGVIRNPQSDRVVDGEVCGSGAIADEVQAFLHWVPIKLETAEALRLCVSCGDTLVKQGELSCARDCFYQYVMTTCEEIERQGARGAMSTAKSSAIEGRLWTKLMLTPDEECWVARAIFGAASMGLRTILARDPHIRFSSTLSRIVAHLRRIQHGIDRLLRQPKDVHDGIAWLVQEGMIQLFDWCEPLTVKGHGNTVSEFLAWALLATEGVVNLSTVKHLPWRTRLAVTTCYAFEDAGKPQAAAKCARHATEKVSELRRQEEMDPPVPVHVVKILDAADGDLRVLNFKYSALVTGAGKRTAVSSAGDRPEEEIEVEGVNSLTEEDLSNLLAKHVPLTEEQPTALLELLGRGRGPLRGRVLLSAGDASVVCKRIMALLLVEKPTKTDVHTENGGTSRNSGVGEDTQLGGNGDQQEAIPKMFALELDQEMQLLREMYRLGEFQHLESMLPRTTGRLREAGSFLPKEESSVHWFEIALWTASKHLSTWKDKPEAQGVPRGGMKITPAQKRSIGARDGGGSYGSNVGVNESGQDKPDSWGGVCGMGVPGADSAVDEKTLRDTISSSAEVVELPQYDTDADAVRINLAPILAMVHLLRKALFGPYRHVLEVLGDSVLDAATSVWEPYVGTIIRALDLMPMGADVDRSLLDSLLLCTETINACLWVLNADDAALKAAVALRLGILQADFCGDYRKSCQTLRSAIEAIDKHRQELTSHHLHFIDSIATNTNHSDQQHAIALARASLTSEFNGMNPVHNSAMGGVTARTQSREQDPRDPGFHELAAMHLDLISTLFRVELLMGRDISCRLARYQKEKQTAELAALRKASTKNRGSRSTVSKVTFGDSDGRLDTQAGSLTLGWTGVPPMGNTGVNGTGVLETNAVVCAAGAGALPSTGTAQATGARTGLLDAGVDMSSSAVQRIALQNDGAQVETCPATEIRLIAEFRRNPYARAVLLMTMSRFRARKSDQEVLLVEASSLLRQAKSTENDLSHGLPPDAAGTRAGTSEILQSQPQQGVQSTSNASTELSANTPAPPYILSRSHNSIELLPTPFLVPSTTKLENDYTRSGGGGRGLSLASNATSTNQSQATTGSVQKPGKALVRRVAKVFAVAAFDESGNVIGQGIGTACKPVETLNPLPLALCWSLLGRTALALDCKLIAGQAAKAVYRELVISVVNEKGRATSDLRAGWMANPLNAQAFSPIALAKCPRGILQAFVQSCFVLVETLDEEAIVKAACSNATPLEEEISRLSSLKRLSLACEASVLLRDWDLVTRSVCRAYDLLLPLLGVAAMGRFLFQVLCQLHQCLCLVPRDEWDGATKTAFACLAYQITIKGHEIGEQAAMNKTLLDSAAGAQSLEGLHCGTLAKISARENEGVNHRNDVPQQIALLEIWMALPELGLDGERSAIRKALCLPPSNQNSTPEAEGGGSGGGGVREAGGRVDGSPQYIPDVEAVEEVLSLAAKNPLRAWELLKGGKYTGHPQRARLVCRVCEAALRRGLASQVISWLCSAGATTGITEDGVEDVGSKSITSPNLFSMADLEPFCVKVLEREGSLATVSYIGGEAEDAELPDETGDGGIDNQGETENERDVDGDKNPNERTELHDASTPLGGNKDILGNVPPTAAESAQLLWLAQVEYLLGVSFLQEAFSVLDSMPRKGRSQSISLSPNTPAPSDTLLANDTSVAATPSIAVQSLVAAGGRRPWGSGSGPFAEGLPPVSEVSHAKIENSDKKGVHTVEAGGHKEKEEKEEGTIEQLEDDGAIWPTIENGIAAAVSDPDASIEAGVSSSFADYISCALVHLTKAASRARWGRSWTKVQSSCGLLWNTVVSLWLSPQDFQHSLDPPKDETARTRLRLGEHHARIYAKACEALLDAVDATTHNDRPSRMGNASGGSEQGASPGSNVPNNLGNTRTDMEDQIECNQTTRIEPEAKALMDGAELESPSPDVRWVSRFVEWVLQGLLHCQCWGVVVKVGNRLVESTMGVCRGHRVYPLIMQAQKRLCTLALDLLKEREFRLERLEETFQTALGKKRRRKVLKVVETKSKDEIEHDKAREPLIVAIGDARVRRQIHDHRLGTLVQSRDTYINTKSVGRRSLDDARVALAEYFALCAHLPISASPESTAQSEGINAEDDPAASPARESLPCTGAERVDIQGSLKALVKLYASTVDLLREKRERELLTEALNDLGDLHALGGRYDLAARAWTDAIDGICSTLDSGKQWRSLFDRLRAANPSSGGPPGGGGSLALALGGWGCLAGGTVIGKLSMYCEQANLGGQLHLCLMAAEMFRAPLETSLPFPQRACDYASYALETLGGSGLTGAGLWIEDRRLSAPALYAAMMHVQGVLTAVGRVKEAFPVLAILEHVASKVLLDPLKFTHVKLARAHCLAKAGFPAEAASALAAVLKGGGPTTTTGNYAGRRSRKSTSPPPSVTVEDVKGKGNAGAKVGAAKKSAGGKDAGKKPVRNEEAPKEGEQTMLDANQDKLSKSGLRFYGLAEYNNHLPLTHPENAAAVSWLIGDGKAYVEETEPALAEGEEGETNSQAKPRHVRLLKRGLSEVDSALPGFQGEKEACIIALTRAQLLVALADCNALPQVGNSPTGQRSAEIGRGEAVLRRVRDATDCMLGEVLQVVMKRISPKSINRSSSGTPQTERSSRSENPTSSDGSLTGDKGIAAAVAAEAAVKHATAAAPGAADGWVAAVGAEALLLRGRLALLDGKLRVCRYHTSRGLAVLLRHGRRGSSLSALDPEMLVDCDARRASTSGIATESRIYGHVTFANSEDQPWSVILTWLELRYYLAVVALLQGRTADAVFQIDKGLDEAKDVGEVVVSKRLRRLRAQAFLLSANSAPGPPQWMPRTISKVAVASGDLEKAVLECRQLASDYESDAALGLDLVAVLRLLAKIRRQQSLVCGGANSDTLKCLADALDALRRADMLLTDMAEDLGWIGTGVLTYAALDDNRMTEDLQPHLLHALGTSFKDVTSLVTAEKAFGVVPSDEEDISVPSVLANLYLPPLHILLAVRLSMVDLMEGLDYHNNAFLHASLPGGSGKRDCDGTNIVAISPHKCGTKWAWTASHLADESMLLTVACPFTKAIMRHLSHPHPALRAQALFLVGKLRLRCLRILRVSPWSKRNWSDGKSLDDENGTRNSVGASIAIAPPREFVLSLEDATRTAFTAALRVSFERGGHDWMLMRDACISIVVLQLESLNHSIAGCEGYDDEDGTEGHRCEKADEAHKAQLAAHYLRLAAAIASGRRRLDAELGEMSVEPLPPAVVDAMPRSALDELAGRSGKSPDDDPLCLDARGLLQFFRARVRERSLAAAPTDLLPASSVCQVSNDSSTSAAAGGLLRSICVMWLWTDPVDIIGETNDKSSSKNSSRNHHRRRVDPGNLEQTEGLYTMRTGLILLGSGDDAKDRRGSSTVPIVTLCVEATKVLGMKREAAQLKALLAAFRAKYGEADPIPSSLRDRIAALLIEARNIFARAAHPSIGGRTASSGTLFSSHDSGGVKAYCTKMTGKTLNDLEMIFDAEAGADVENEDLCGFLRAAIG